MTPTQALFSDLLHVLSVVDLVYEQTPPAGGQPGRCVLVRSRLPCRPVYICVHPSITEKPNYIFTERDCENAKGFKKKVLRAIIRRK